MFVILKDNSDINAEIDVHCVLHVYQLYTEFPCEAGENRGAVTGD